MRVDDHAGSEDADNFCRGSSELTVDGPGIFCTRIPDFFETHATN